MFHRLRENKRLRLVHHAAEQVDLVIGWWQNVPAIFQVLSRLTGTVMTLYVAPRLAVAWGWLSTNPLESGVLLIGVALAIWAIVEIALAHRLGRHVHRGILGAVSPDLLAPKVEPDVVPGAARGGRSLDVGVRTVNVATWLMEAGEKRMMGGWLYVADLEITNREPRAVSLHLSLVVRLIDRPGAVSRMTLEASYVSAAEIDDWLNRTKRLTELGPIDHLPNPIPIDPERSRRGYVAFLLPSHMIPRHSAGLTETGAMLSEHPPDSHALIVEDSVSEKARRIEPWDAFKMQAYTREMDAMSERVRRSDSPSAPPSTLDTSEGTPRL